ncbi:MAG: mandelate racemase/muconate lactonizing enzyme family protein [Chloroflexota bacterium]
MKVTRVETMAVNVPLEVPFLAGNLVRTAPHAIIQAYTDDGLVGLGYCFSISPRGFNAMKAALDDLAEELVGENPLETERIAAKLHRAFSWEGPFGLFNMVQSAIDIALWDIAGKAYGQPLYRLLGGRRDRAPAYFSGALWRNYSPSELGKSAESIVKQGWKAIKMRLGGEPRAEDEVRRAQAVRSAIGDDIQLMVDINQGWSPPQAITMGRRLEPFNYYWIEDPVPHQDFAGSARVAAALDTAICAGEYHYGKEPFLRLIGEGCVDIAMIDLLRVGGITEWRKAAAVAETYGVPVASHLLPEVHAHLIAAVPNGLTTEYMPWSIPLFRETPALENGELVLTEKPGHGLELDMAAIARWKM